jgi:hypothetical protein
MLLCLETSLPPSTNQIAIFSIIDIRAAFDAATEGNALISCQRKIQKRRKDEYRSIKP